LKTKKDIQDLFRISYATIHNWKKTGFIPNYPNGEYYEEELFQEIVNKISKQRLNKRANRLNTTKSLNASFNCRNTSNTINCCSSIFEKDQNSLNGFMFIICLILLKRKGLVAYEISNQELEIKCKNHKFKEFIIEWEKNCENIDLESIEKLEEIEFPETQKDFAGICYESLRNLSEKVLTGAFFTPKELLKNLHVKKDNSIADPCSGTGSIIINIISKDHDPEKIHLFDIDELALRIARVNFALFFGRLDKTVNIKVSNILWNSPIQKFDIVISNPPFGAKLSVNDKQKIKQNYPELKTNETFSIALLKSAKMLNPGAKMHFILPDSFLYVKKHLETRKFVFSNFGNISISHFGNAFKGIMSKIIRLDIENIKPSDNKLIFINRNFKLEYSNQILEKNNFRPPYLCSSQELSIISKILEADVFNLKDKARFGLGIVTGNNSLHLSGTVNGKSERIYRGKDLMPFRFKDTLHYINYRPDTLQQVSPTEFYRQPKICYRFISDKIICLADYEGTLVLNSINCFVPEKSISLKALSALLNSLVVSFIFRKLYNSSKVLRNHIEELPLPLLFFDNQKEYFKFYERGKMGEDIFWELHNYTCNLYGLNKQDADYIYDISG
jgi:type I restriction-modification system DNA methylase subunit